MIRLNIPKWNITEMTGYEPKTTFWMDFSIADKFGLDAVKDTFERAFKEWCKNAVYVTELAMVVNHKCWEHYHRGQNELPQFLSNHNEVGQYYKDKYYEILDWVDENLSNDDLTYFYNTLD